MSSALTIISTVLGGIGLGFQVDGEVRKAQAQKKSERLRRQQENLNTARQRREILRQAQIAQADITAVAGAQGQLDTSAYSGAISASNNQSRTNTLQVNQNAQIGEGLFSANAAYSSGLRIAGFGQALTSLGQAAINNGPTIERVATYATRFKS